MGGLNFVSVILWLVLIIATVGCGSNRVENLPNTLTDSIPIEIPSSTFNLPVCYALNDLEEFINLKIQGQFLDAIINPLKNEKDEVKVQMTKFSNIQLSSQGKEIVCSFPLKVTATILKSRLNFITRDVKPMETELVLELRTPVTLDSNWHLVTRFDLLQIHWVEKPILTWKGIDVDLTKKLEEYINRHEEKLTRFLDTAINKGVSLEKAVGKIWHNLQRPIPIHKKPPHAYIKFICRSITGDFVLGTNEIVCHTSVTANLIMMTDTTVKTNVLKLPPFKSKTGIPRHSDVHLYAFAAFEDINNELKRILKGRTFSTNGFSATLDSLNVYGSDSGLTVNLTTSGDISGMLVATGIPDFDSLSQSFSLRNFQFHLASTSILVRAGNALLHDMIRDTVQSHLTMGMDSLIGKVPDVIERAIAKGKTGRAIDMNINDLQVLSCGIKMGAKRIHFNVHTRLVAGINLKKINPGKLIHIVPKRKPP